MQGKIVKGISGFYYIHVVGAGIYECKAKGSFRNQKIKPLVGDNVEIAILDENEKKGNIEKILPRKNELIRPAVANIDGALVVFAAAKPKPNFHLLDRFLVMMEYQHIPAVLCFNKTDLVDEEERKRLQDIYAAAGYPICFVSAKEQIGIETVKEQIEGNLRLSRSVRCRKIFAYECAAVRDPNGDRRDQYEDRKRKAYNETFTGHTAFEKHLSDGHAGIQLHVYAGI